MHDLYCLLHSWFFIIVTDGREVALRGEAKLGFCSINQPGVLLSSLDMMLIHNRIQSMKERGGLLLLSGWDASPSQDTQHEVGC